MVVPPSEVKCLLKKTGHLPLEAGIIMCPRNIGQQSPSDMVEHPSKKKEPDYTTTKA
jgi:hypothetical protein